MDSKIRHCKKGNSIRLTILFFGDSERARRLQEAVAPCGWEIHVETQARSVPDEGVSTRPDLVILDNFPESVIARSAYYQLCHARQIPFLALNDSPGAMRFLHVNALSFIKIIHRDPAPEELIQAISDLIGNYRKKPSLPSRESGFLCRSLRHKPVDLCCLQDRTCC